MTSPEIAHYFSLRYQDKAHDDALAHTCLRYGILPANMVSALTAHRNLIRTELSMLQEVDFEG